MASEIKVNLPLISMTIIKSADLYFTRRNSRSKNQFKYIFNFNNLFLDKGSGHKLTHTNKNEISINLFPVCYQSLSIILFCSRLKLSNE